MRIVTKHSVETIHNMPESEKKKPQKDHRRGEMSDDEPALEGYER